MHLKRLLVVLIAMCLSLFSIFSLVGCGGGAEPTGEPAAEDSQGADEEEGDSDGTDEGSGDTEDDEDDE